MKPKANQTIAQLDESLRRSSRTRTPKEFDYFTISTGRYQDLGGIDLDDDQYEPRRDRKRRRHKDSQDFENNERRQKKKLTASNRICHLLEWKRDIELPVLTETKDHKSFIVKNILHTDLSKFGSHIEALFINIKWSDQKGGVTVKDFRKLQIENRKLINRGIVFIWAEKELIGELMDIMEEKEFVYVENFQIVHLSLEKGMHELEKFCIKQSEKPKREGSSIQTISETENEDFEKKQDFLENLEKLGSLEANKIIMENDSSYLKKSKRILLMYRKHDNKKDNLQLRHQRTCDVLFDVVSEKNTYSDAKCKSYVYKMIQTLLPRSTENFQSAKIFSLMELWGDKDSARKGWITVSQK